MKSRGCGNRAFFPQEAPKNHFSSPYRLNNFLTFPALKNYYYFFFFSKKRTARIATHHVG
jgi:hypothetical protein